MTPPFQGFPKIPRLSREVVITEKIDGTNAQVLITDDGEVFAGSRTCWITPEADNHGFARWVKGNESELLKLGPGRHFGEWWGSGIQRGYGLRNGDKRLSLFNTGRWNVSNVPECVSVVPELWRGPFSLIAIELAVNDLIVNGSRAAPGFMQPEGVMVFHSASRTLFKKTIKDDDKPKGLKE